jgi:hypothetical protein
VREIDPGVGERCEGGEQGARLILELEDQGRLAGVVPPAKWRCRAGRPH